MKMKESSVLGKLEDEWFGRKSTDVSCKNSEVEPYAIETVVSQFVLLSLAFILCMTIVGIEVLIRRITRQDDRLTIAISQQRPHIAWN